MIGILSTLGKVQVFPAQLATDNPTVPSGPLPHSISTKSSLIPPPEIIVPFPLIDQLKVAQSAAEL